MRNILLIISYTGTLFSGWQKQIKNGVETARTVQGEIEKALSRIHKHPIELIGAGRTDAGVHASAQAAHFITSLHTMYTENFIRALNSMLPRDIRIMAAREVPPDFHARFSAIKRTYRYRLYCPTQMPPWEDGRCLHLRRYPDIHHLNRMLLHFHGERDCTAFSAAGDMSKSKSRYIYNAHFFYQGNTLLFEITANAFLWKMVRSITGTLLQLEKNNMPENSFEEIANSKIRRRAGPTAAPHGLFLHSIEYPTRPKP